MRSPSGISSWRRGCWRCCPPRSWCCSCRSGSSRGWWRPGSERGIRGRVMAQVHLRDVRKSYGDLEIIHGVAMDIEDGEFVVILGPSGCGKSTLLRTVAGLETITGGEIVIGDRVVNNLEPMDRDIAMVFQNYALYPHMTVYENMSYGLRIKGFSKTDIGERVNKAAEILELKSFL